MELTNAVKEATMKYLKDIEKFVENKVVFCGIDVHDSSKKIKLKTNEGS